MRWGAWGEGVILVSCIHPRVHVIILPRRVPMPLLFALALIKSVQIYLSQSVITVQSRSVKKTRKKEKSCVSLPYSGIVETEHLSLFHRIP